MDHRRVHTNWAWKSKGEEKIYKLLDAWLPKDSWDYQVTFNDCRNPKTNYLLRYDFGIAMENGKWLLIEYNARVGHEIKNPRWTDEEFRDAQYRYQVKMDYKDKAGHHLLELWDREWNYIEALLSQWLEANGLELADRPAKIRKTCTE